MEQKLAPNFFSLSNKEKKFGFIKQMSSHPQSSMF